MVWTGTWPRRNWICSSSPPEGAASAAAKFRRERQRRTPRARSLVRKRARARRARRRRIPRDSGVCRGWPSRRTAATGRGPIRRFRRPRKRGRARRARRRAEGGTRPAVALAGGAKLRVARLLGKFRGNALYVVGRRAGAHPTSHPAAIERREAAALAGRKKRETSLAADRRGPDVTVPATEASSPVGVPSRRRFQRPISCQARRPLGFDERSC